MHSMLILVVGSGKLARELLANLPGDSSSEVIAWANRTDKPQGKPVVVHAGSGRELAEVMAYCGQTGATLLELSTGSELRQREVHFPVVLCPNTNILMLKLMAMLARSGRDFKNYDKQVIESHQATKSSTPGTAVSMAEYLGVPPGEIVSVRDPVEQTENLKIPAEYLSRHAFHRIVIAAAQSSITIETLVFGAAPYAEGVGQIIAAIRSHPLENRYYDVTELVERGWV